MRVTAMKFRKRSLGLAAAIGIAALSLTGCVVYPDNYGYGGGYYAPAYVAPPPVYGSVIIGGGWGGGWHGGGWRH